MARLHRLLLEFARESYCVGANPSGKYDYTALHSYGLSNEIADTDVFEHGIDLATLRSVTLAGSEPASFAVLTFRGTQPPRLTPDVEVIRSITADWLQDAAMVPVPAPGNRPHVTIHHGFSHSLETLFQTVNASGQKLGDKIDRLRNQGVPLLITGHSKGGAIAHLAAWKLAVEQNWSTDRLRIVSFAAARSGNAGFANYYREMFGDHAIRYEIIEDVVPDLPAGPGQDLISRVTGLFHQLVAAAALEYYGVGRAIRGHFNELGWTTEEINHFVRTLLDGALANRSMHEDAHYMPLLARAHTLAAGAPYDHLVCPAARRGESCNHGVI